ncbi:undecaprenyl-diphosphate phosphatase [Maricaulis virginensis]|uniref:Undecaprenyl-diphosphatase n=1 Tax=Maricaulis virginensis TaxID=144022 RepID=A0A9W6IPY6_9PROT|nr:undecaprenyl-diphosphate phosphatase [Maricaulis virginensis]GLK53169.1 undecaprenyl-diphosphatase 1 [Maricaulis virginensis]
MPLIQLIVLALVQGLTEFLPISSSAHLILAPGALGVEDQGPLIDVMAHAGSLVAVLVYFWRDIFDVARGKLALLTGRITPGGRIALLVAASMPPVFIFAGALYAFDLVDALRSPAVIAGATLVFAVPLWLADRYGKQTGTLETLGFKDAALIGIAQLFALIPGASRSGVTMTAGRALGLKRSESARFSMLMAIPVIAAFALVSVIDLAGADDAGASLEAGLIVAVLSFFAAWASIAVMMKLVDRIGFLPFVLYRLALGLALIGLIIL